MNLTIRLLLLALSTLLLAIGQPAFAQKTATTASVKLGYFDLQKVKAQTVAGDSEGLKSQAERQFRQYIENGNKVIQKARDEKKGEEEVKTLVKQVQTELAAKRQALAGLVESQIFADTQRLMQTVGEVAREKSLDLVIDVAGVYAGGQKVIDNGVDVTDDVISKLNPAAVQKKQSTTPPATTTGAKSASEKR